jgi:hypothetical protein
MQNSPSGSGLITDYIGTLAIFGILANTAAGEYYVAPGLIGALVALIPVTPGSELSALAGGVQTRQGRFVRTRLLNTGTNTALGKRKPTKLQWQIVDHVTGDVIPVGKVVEVPWGPNSTTFVNLSQFPQEAVDFGSVRWATGDLYILKVTVGAIVSGAPGDQALLISGETAYVALPPVSGPLGSPP